MDAAFVLLRSEAKTHSFGEQVTIIARVQPRRDASYGIDAPYLLPLPVLLVAANILESVVTFWRTSLTKPRNEDPTDCYPQRARIEPGPKLAESGSMISTAHSFLPSLAEMRLGWSLSRDTMFRAK